MYLERFGTGEKIYIGLHGWGGDRRVFTPISQFVPPDATVYSADLPGVLMSSAPRVWTVDEIVGEIVDTISAYGKPRVTLIGHCGGASFGLLAASEAENLVERIVMIDPFAYLPRYFKIFLNAQIGERAYKATFANSFGRWMTNQALRNRRRADSNLTAVFGETNHESARRYLSLFAEMEKIKIPEIPNVKVDLIYGDKSFGAVRKSVAALQKSMPHARIHQLENAAHLPVEEATEQLCDIIFASV